MGKRNYHSKQKLYNKTRMDKALMIVIGSLILIFVSWIWAIGIDKNKDGDGEGFL